MPLPITEKKPVTTAIPDTGIASPPSGISKSTPAALAIAAIRVVAVMAAMVAMLPVTTSLRSGCGWLLWRPAVPATTWVSLMIGAVRRQPLGQSEPRELVVVEGDDLGDRPPVMRSASIVSGR